MRSRLAVVAFATALLATSPARADVHTDAAKQFEEGRKLLREKEPEKALAAFKQSIALEPSIGGYFNVAAIHEQLGHYREAADAYKKSRDLAHDKGDTREKDASDALSKLLDTHNYVFLKVDDLASTPGLRIVVDNELVPATQYNGEVFRGVSLHEILVSATGHKDLKLSNIANRQQVPVQLGEASTTVPPPPPPPSETSGRGWGWQKWTGVGLGAAGLITVGIGGVMALNWASDKSDVDAQYQQCKDDSPPPKPTDKNQEPRCTKRFAGDLEQHAKDNMALSVQAWVVTGIGAALLVGGAVLFITAPDKPTENPSAGRIHVVPQVSARESGLSVVGTF